MTSFLSFVLIINCLILFLLFCVTTFMVYNFYQYNKKDIEYMRARIARPICAYCDNRIEEDTVEDEDD